MLLITHRGEEPEEAAVPGDYRKILAIVRAADGPVQVKAVREELGLQAAVRGKLEPPRAKGPSSPIVAGYTNGLMGGSSRAGSRRGRVSTGA
ncbi:hypothetical protein [Streptomyces malaysiensis]|uniref:hypothetical protein n=1 Tax=Streptomyces malaysiensis TaxID=92644 RepID=UPI003713125B